MPNSIDLVTAFKDKADLIYKEASKTAFLDSLTEQNDHQAANEIKIFKISMVGMGTYDRAEGYPAGDITAEWETIKLLYERGRAFSVDRMDNEETFGLTYGKLVGEYIRTRVVPELDAARFARWAGTTDIQTVAEAALTTAAGVLTAIDVAAQKLDDEEVPEDGRYLFISSALRRLLNASVTRSLANESEFNRMLQKLDEFTVVPVPQSRFYTQVTFDDGDTSSAGGYAKTASTGRDINFILMHREAIWQAVKLNNLKVFTPEENQTADAWLCQHRLYHDGGVYDNKVKGIYLHKKNS